MKLKNKLILSCLFLVEVFSANLFGGKGGIWLRQGSGNVQKNNAPSTYGYTPSGGWDYSSDRHFHHRNDTVQVTNQNNNNLGVSTFTTSDGRVYTVTRLDLHPELQKVLDEQKKKEKEKADQEKTAKKIADEIVKKAEKEKLEKERTKEKWLQKKKEQEEYLKADKSNRDEWFEMLKQREQSLFERGNDKKNKNGQKCKGSHCRDLN